MSQQNCHQFSLKPPGGEMFPSVTPTCKSVIFPESEAENQCCKLGYLQSWADQRPDMCCLMNHKG